MNAKAASKRLALGCASTAIAMVLGTVSTPGPGSTATGFQVLGQVFAALLLILGLCDIGLAARSMRARKPAPSAECTPETRIAAFGSVPHPLDVDVSILPLTEIVQVQAGNRSVRAYLTSCPDGCGVLAWTDQILPFNASTPRRAEDMIRDTYTKDQ